MINDFLIQKEYLKKKKNNQQETKENIKKQHGTLSTFNDSKTSRLKFFFLNRATTKIDEG